MIAISLITNYFVYQGKINTFHSVFKNECYLDQFKTFFNEIIPLPIIIGNFKENSNIFELKIANESAKSIFGTENSEIENAISIIRVDSSGAGSIKEGEKTPIAREISESFYSRMVDNDFLLNSLEKIISKLKINTFYTITSKQQKNDNIIINFEVKVARIIWYDKTELALCFHDIGIYKAFDEQKNKVLANVSHNLRTPLNTANANLELALAEKPVNKELRKFIKNAKTGCQMLTHAVNDLLD